MSFDSLAFRKALGQFATGVTVVSVATDDGVHGMTANSFSSVSLDPPLVLVCIDKTRQSHALVQEKGRFGMSILAEDQQPISNWFAGRREHAVDVRWRRTGVETPVLEGALAWFDCSLAHAYDGGDHTIFVGQVERFQADGGTPLLFFKGRYTTIGPETE